MHASSHCFWHGESNAYTESAMECIASDYAVSLQRLSTALHHVSLRPQRLATSYVAKNIFLISRSWGILAMCSAYLTACWLHIWDSSGICVFVASSSSMMLGPCPRRAIRWACQPNSSSLSCSAVSRAHKSAPNITVEYTQTCLSLSPRDSVVCNHRTI